MIEDTYLEVGKGSLNSALKARRSELRLLAHESLEGSIDVRSKGVLDVRDDGGRVGFVDGWAGVGVVGCTFNLLLEVIGSLLDGKSSEETSIVGVYAVAEGGDAVVDGVQIGLDGRGLAREDGSADAGSEEEELGDGNHVGGLWNELEWERCLLM